MNLSKADAFLYSVFFFFFIGSASKILKRAFGFLLLVLVMATTGTLCSTTVFCLSQGFGTQFLEYTTVLPTVVVDVLLWSAVDYKGWDSLFGLQFVVKNGFFFWSQSVADAAYNNFWYNGSQSYKRSIFIQLMRAQKAAEINAFGFQQLSLKAFQMVIAVLK